MPSAAPDPGNLSRYLYRGSDAGSVVLRVEDRVVTRAELRQLVEDAAEGLQRLGLERGGLVAARLTNSVEAVVVLLAVWRLGCAVAPVSPLLSQSEARRAIERLRPIVVVGHGGDVAVFAQDGTSPRVEPLAGGGAIATVAPGGEPGSQASVSEDAALVLFTSGTSGRSKPVAIGHASMVGAIESMMAALGARGRRPEGGPPNLIAFPLFHLAGIYNLVLGLRNVREVLLMRRFQVPEFVDLIERYHIPSVIANPTMLHMLNEEPGLDPARLRSLRFVRSGSAPLPPAVVKRFRERFGIPVLNCYGQTETAGEIIGWSTGDLATFELAKLGSVGRPHQDVELRFVDEHLCDVPPGQVGELCVRSPFLMRGYLDSESATSEKYVDDYLRTGDLGYIDEDGFVWLVGRLSDVIVCGGFKVMPEEVEDVLYRHPEVREVMVAGLPDDRLGEVVEAFVVATVSRPNLPLELIEFARQELAGYKVPRQVHVVTELPRNETGKLLRSQAADLGSPLKTRVGSERKQ